MSAVPQQCSSMKRIASGGSNRNPRINYRLAGQSEFRRRIAHSSVLLPIQTVAPVLRRLPKLAIPLQPALKNPKYTSRIALRQAANASRNADGVEKPHLTETR